MFAIVAMKAVPGEQYVDVPRCRWRSEPDRMAHSAALAGKSSNLTMSLP